MKKVFLLLAVLVAGAGAHPLWWVLAGTSPEKPQESGHTDAVVSVAFSPDGRLLASGSWDKSIRTWDVSTGRPIKILTGHAAAVTRIAFSPNGQELASTSSDKSVRIWDVANAKTLRTLTGHAGEVIALAFSPDGKWIATGSKDNTAKVWDAATGREIFSSHADDWVQAVAFSPDGELLAAADYDGRVRVFDVPAWRLRYQVDVTPLLTKLVIGIPKVPVFGLAFSPDGRVLATGTGIGFVRLWDANSGSEISIFLDKSDGVLSVAFSSDGRLLASSNGGGVPGISTIDVWDVGSGRKAAVLSAHHGWVWQVAFSPDGKLLASCSWDRTLRLWDTKTWREVRVIGQEQPQQSSR